MKFILLIEMSVSLPSDKRYIINSRLDDRCYEKPKRSVYLLEVEKEMEMKAIVDWVREIAEEAEIKIEYYRLAEKNTYD